MDSRSEDDERPTDSLLQAEAPAAPEGLRLVVVAGPDCGREILLTRGTYFVGKAEGCDLVLSDGAVSRRHLQLQLVREGVALRDLESKNGSFLGGARLTEVVAGAGALITIGETTLRLVSERAPRMPPSSAGSFGGLHGRSLAMRELYSVLERVAASDAPVLIEGETGTGKELCAHAIHAAGARASGPFTICDLGAAAPSLIESELFGHVRGAFTGADRDREGAFVRAHRGSLFLDEIGELDAALQPRLLRALERGEVKPLGGSQMVRVDARVIAATNRNLAAEVQAGRFRSDLFYRLGVLRVELPPLRARRDDIPLLVERFLAEDAPDAGVDSEALALIVEYDWPGNVRELRNVVRRATSLLAGERVIAPRHLGIDAQLAEPERFHAAKQALVTAWEAEYLKQLLARAGGNMSRAARIAGLERAYLYRLVRKHGLRNEGDEP